jgi:hypothetical protein
MFAGPRAGRAFATGANSIADSVEKNDAPAPVCIGLRGGLPRALPFRHSLPPGLTPGLLSGLAVLNVSFQPRAIWSRKHVRFLLGEVLAALACDGAFGVLGHSGTGHRAGVLR